MKPMKRIAYFAVFLGLASQAWAVPVAEIIQKANHAAYYQGKNGKARIEMHIQDAQGREQERNFSILRMDVDDKVDSDQRFYVYFNRPADVRKMSFLVWKNVKSEDDRWLYLPSLDLVKRIASSDKRTSFVGSHFFYEDVSGRNPEEDAHVLLEDDKDYYILKSTPKKPETVEFAYYKTWIHKTTFMPVKTEYVDAAGHVYRTYEATKLEMVEGYPTVTASKMTDTKMGGFTTMTYTVVDYDVDLDASIFTERYLRTPPMKVLR